MENIKSIAQKEKERKVEIVNSDMKLLEKGMQSDDEKTVKEIHMQIDAKYQSVIINWGNGMSGYIRGRGFAYDFMEMDSMKSNFIMMKSKLEAFCEGWNLIQRETQEMRDTSDIVIQNINSNHIAITVTFDEIRRQMDAMPGLTNEETEELKKKVDELESVSKENLPKKKKWEKIKPVIKFVLDKGADVAIAFMTLVAQNNMWV